MKWKEESKLGREEERKLREMNNSVNPTEEVLMVEKANKAKMAKARKLEELEQQTMQ
jgi:hypothetical protein